MAELARRTNVNPSTFAKFKNDPNNKATLEAATIAMIEEASGLKAFEFSSHAKPRGLAEEESARYDAEPLQVIDGAIRAMMGTNNGLDPWVMKSNGLEAAGYNPGDVLMVDLNAQPEPGDVVCAQVYDRNGRAETVFRIYDHPFLVAMTYKVNLAKPLLIDNDRVAVRGVVVASFRPRRSAAAA